MAPSTPSRSLRGVFLPGCSCPPPTVRPGRSSVARPPRQAPSRGVSTSPPLARQRRARMAPTASRLPHRSPTSNRQRSHRLTGPPGHPTSPSGDRCVLNVVPSNHATYPPASTRMESSGRRTEPMAEHTEEPRVIRCKGSWLEIGRQYGEELRGEIAHAYRAIEELAIAAGHDGISLKARINDYI